MKRCKSCGELKPLDEFYYLRHRDNYSGKCKACFGLKEQVCVICNKKFIAKDGRKLCSNECKKKYRPQTYKDCLQCGIRFGPVGHLNIKFCSKRCAYEYRVGKPSKSKGIARLHTRKAREGECLVCGKKFRAVKDFKGREQKYCSHECWAKNWSKAPKKYKCKNCGKSFFSKDKRGRKYCSHECAHKYMVGERSPKWKDGLSLQRDRARLSNKVSDWRIKVYIRDNHICQECGNTRNLHAHHIKSWSEYPELRFDVNNGKTLCEKCHGKVHGKDFTNKRSRKCKNCGAKITGQGKTGMCRSCSIKANWKSKIQRWETFTGQKAVKL